MLIHSPVSADAWEVPGIFFFQNFLAGGAVPVFFLLSGYLGARGLADRSIPFRSYALAKVHSLVLPFLFWNVVVLFLVLAVKAAGLDASFRGGGAYFDVQPTVTSIGGALLGIGRPPVVYQFWFLRDLIVVTFAAFFICRYLPKVPLLPWLFFFIPLPVAPSMGYYLLGTRLHASIPPDRFPDVRSAAFYGLCWVLVGIATLNGFFEVPFPIQQLGSAFFFLTLAIVASAIPAAARLAVLGHSVFFIYAAHEPLQTLFGRAWTALGISGHDSFVYFLGVPLIVFSVCLAGFYLLRKMSPRLLALATGGRQG